jgi:hypothetical protein
MHEEIQNSTYENLIPTLTKKNAIVYIFIIGFAVFFNSLFNPFILDDFTQIVNSPSISSLSNIPSFFYKGYAFAGFQSFTFLHMQYRPFLLTGYTLIHLFFGNYPGFFHFFQLLIHIFNSILIFLIFSRFFKNKISFLLSLIFLVHPINSEAVIYIADLQDVLFVFFGLSAVYLVLKNKLTDNLQLGIVAILLLFSSFAKETGILFSAILLLYSWLFNRTLLKRVASSVLISVTVYMIFRLVASIYSIVNTFPSLIQKAALLDRLATIPQIIFYYFSKFFAPIHLSIAQWWLVKKIDFTNFLLPSVIDLCIFLAVLFIGMYLYRRRDQYYKLYILFSVWLLIGLGLHIQIVPLDVTVADRYFYFPVIGLLGVIGIIINIVSKRFEFNHIFKYTGIVLIVCIVSLLSILTIVRNSQWQTRAELYSHDLKYSDSPILLTTYGGLLILNGQLDEAKYYLERSVYLDPQLGYNLNNLALWFERKGQFDNAKKLYQESIRLKYISPQYIAVSNDGLTRIALFSEKDFKEAKRLSKIALQHFPSDILAAEYLTISEYYLGEKEEALNTIQKLNEHVVTSDTQQLYLLIKADKLPFPVLQESGDVVY